MVYVPNVINVRLELFQYDIFLLPDINLLSLAMHSNRFFFNVDVKIKLRFRSC